MARTVEDVLSRRMRALLLDARAAQRSAPIVARLLAWGLGQGSEWIEFETKRFVQLAHQFYFASGTIAEVDSGATATTTVA
jgi:glycerol-3-phosphate dehydrogenase